MAKIELSVAIIFKNEIRCLERCLKSLQPLRERISMEIVMADTGSDDGSREIAERYADVLFDFPWVNDFAAARNAVLDRCSGVWCLMVDSDEWLDGDTEELLVFLYRDAGNGAPMGAVVLRNYYSDTEDNYTDFIMPRLLRMRARPRYEGAIHELPKVPDKKQMAVPLSHTILHHDGYVMLNDGSEAGREKRARNLALLRAELEKNPDSLRRLMQYIESGGDAPDLPDRLRHAIALVERKRGNWKTFGASILRHGVVTAFRLKLPELELWIGRAEALFPDSYFTRIDVGMTRCILAYNRGDFGACIRCGEAYLRAVKQARTDPAALKERACGVIAKESPLSLTEGRTILAAAYAETGLYGQALAQLREINPCLLDGEKTAMALRTLLTLQTQTALDTSPIITKLWRSTKDGKAPARAEARETAFLRMGYAVLEAADPQNALRPAYTMFLPLAGVCDAGDMAAVLDFDWRSGENGLALARAFADAERKYLPRVYTPETLSAPALLPPLHRMGLCCVRAFDALSAGDPTGYVRALREGLEICPEMKPMTEFLLGRVDRLTAPPELLALAEQVKALLAKYPANDPAVAELKNSPVYQKVAYLIEE